MESGEQSVIKWAGMLALWTVAFLGFWGACWLQQEPSHEELIGNFGVFFNLWEQGRQQGGIPWWTPDYMGGHSTMPFMTLVIPILALLAGGLVFGSYAGFKVVALCFAAFAAATMFLWVWEWTRRPRAAFWAGAFYVCAPAMSLRLPAFEHVANVLCFAWAPLILWALHRAIAQPSWHRALWLAVAVAGMLLTYAKLAVMWSPAVLFYLLWRLKEESQPWSRLWAVAWRTGCLLVPLAVLPLGPAWRESHLMVFFQLDPFRQWQQVFSQKSVLEWLNRDGILWQGWPSLYQTEAAGFYLGLAIIGLLAGALIAQRRKAKPADAGFRVLIGMGLMLHWFSFGIVAPIAWHFRLLGDAERVQDWVIPLLWLSLLLPGWILWQIWPRTGRLAGLWPLAWLIYLVVPGFAWLESVPLFDQIRAPSAFWAVGGTCCVAAAAGVAADHFFPSGGVIRRWAFSLVLLGITLVDFFPYHRYFARPGLPAASLDAFFEAQRVMASDSRPGRVMAISSRYLYLLTPELAGRPLVSEAAYSYMQPAESAAMMRAAMADDRAWSTWRRVAGIRYLLVDHEADGSEQSEARFTVGMEQVYRKGPIALWRDESALSPAFLAERVVAFPHGVAFFAQQVALLGMNLVGVEFQDVPSAHRALVGFVDPAGKVRYSQEFSQEALPTLVRLNGSRRNVHGSEFVIEGLAGLNGWVVVPENWHPDWRVRVGGEVRQVNRAAGALLSAAVSGQEKALRFTFEPPGWYGVCVGCGLGGWMLAMIALVLLRPVFWGDKVRFWHRSAVASPGPEPKAPDRIEREEAWQKIWVVMPTLNEAENIERVLRGLFELHPKPEVLVVDDGSTDETVKRAQDLGARVLQRKGPHSFGDSYREGFAATLKEGAEVVVQMDADGSHDPAVLADMLQALRTGVDVAIGSRYVPGGGVRNWPWTRYLLSVMAGVYTRWWTGLPIMDPTSGFKAWRRQALEKVLREGIRSDGYALQIELHYRAWRQGFKLVEVPLIFTERVGGTSKMNLRIVAEALVKVPWLVLKDWARALRGFRRSWRVKRARKA